MFFFFLDNYITTLKRSSITLNQIIHNTLGNRTIGTDKLVDNIRTKFNNTWVGFHEDIKKLLLILRKNLFLSHIVERVIRQYITKTQTLLNTPASPPSNPTHFFKLPYVGPFSIVAQNRLRKLLNVIVTILMLS